MTRAEIRRKFDEIVAFAEVEKFLDTPVKRYSSGMYVRLAFAVAAHLEPEILIVDEVLAVGDAEFQQKCLGKMGEVADYGRTVLLVSHNIGSLTNLCKVGLLFKAGSLVAKGSIQEVAQTYRQSSIGNNSSLDNRLFSGTLSSLTVTSITVNDKKGNYIGINSDSEIDIQIDGVSAQFLRNFRFKLSLFKGSVRIATLLDGPAPLPEGHFTVSAKIGAEVLDQVTIISRSEGRE